MTILHPFSLSFIGLLWSSWLANVSFWPRFLQYSQLASIGVILMLSTLCFSLPESFKLLYGFNLWLLIVLAFMEPSKFLNLKVPRATFSLIIYGLNHLKLSFLKCFPTLKLSTSTSLPHFSNLSFLSAQAFLLIGSASFGSTLSCLACSNLRNAYIMRFRDSSMWSFLCATILRLDIRNSINKMASSP